MRRERTRRGRRSRRAATRRHQRRTRASRRTASASSAPRERRSHATNAAAGTRPRESAITIGSLLQPSRPASISPHTSASRPAVESAIPTPSSGCRGPYVSSSRVRASGISTIPTGTFSQKIQCQESVSVSAPPTTGPSDAAPAATAPHAPSTRPRRSAGGGGEDRQRQRRDQRAADALERTRRDQRAGRRRERARGRAGGEDRESGREHPSPAVAVAERGAREQQHREAQRVRAHRPLERLQARAEMVADRRQRGPTTWRSSANMNSAAAVIANVHLKLGACCSCMTRPGSRGGDRSSLGRAPSIDPRIRVANGILGP